MERVLVPTNSGFVSEPKGGYGVLRNCNAFTDYCQEEQAYLAPYGNLPMEA